MEDLAPQWFHYLENEQHHMQSSLGTAGWEGAQTDTPTDGRGENGASWSAEGEKAKKLLQLQLQHSPFLFCLRKVDVVRSLFERKHWHKTRRSRDRERCLVAEL